MAVHTRTWSRGSWTTIIVLSLAGMAYLLGGLVVRLVAILGNHDVPITVPFQGVTVPVAIGDATEPVRISEGVIHVSGLGGLTFVSVLLGEVLRAGAPIALLALLVVFSIRMARERVFDRTNSRLVTWAGVVVLLGWGVGGFFAHMGVNGAMATISPARGDLRLIASSVDLFPLAVGFAIILLGVVFEIGARMQRDTEGLV